MRDALLLALGETRALLARPGNRFEWSAWPDADAALREIDTLIDRITNGATPDRRQLRALYAPTGPLQEVSHSSGWSDTFLELANRVDEALRYG